jgi:MraZ protein
VSFIGQAEVTIDKKSRLAVPAKFRTALESGNLGPGWISMPRGDGMLWLIPEAGFVKLSAGWGDSLIPDEDTAALQRMLFGSSEKVDMDATGRVTLPRRHLDLTGLDGEVAVVGAMSHLEIHDRAGWLAREKERLAQLPSLIAKMSARRTHG